MKIRLLDLFIRFRAEREKIEFTDFNYFYGQMGSGKSSIARLIDYCLGGERDLVLTPALLGEFTYASLSLKVADSDLVLSREAHSDQIRAQWSRNNEPFEVLIPARRPAGEVVPETGIEVVSDLFFHLNGNKPPRVRRSKVHDETKLERLSLRDLLWYCYLDQDTLDSSFFNLDSDANTFKRLKSRDVLRFLVGFHQEHVAELEADLEHTRAERLCCEAGEVALLEALTFADFATEHELVEARQTLETDLQLSAREIKEARNRTRNLRSHTMDSLQANARHLGQQLATLTESIDEIREIIAKDKTHKNELLSLSTRFRRSNSARAVLGGVEFKDCPRCGRLLPTRPQESCTVCGQSHDTFPTGSIDEQSAEQDLDARVRELTELISQHETQLAKYMRQISKLSDEKEIADSELDRVSKDYDSAYLAAALSLEKRHAAIQQQLIDLKRLERLAEKIGDLRRKVTRLTEEERRIRSELKEARERAERDSENLNKLKHLFLDCLLRAKIPGFVSDDVIEMKSPTFLPEVITGSSGGLAVTSFSNLGSGGKKTLFKCCFAVAIHRLAVEIGALLPTFLIIDSPMKNISERENREQFEGFHQMLYDLSQSELKETQFILIDKEFSPPPEDFEREFSVRHMMPNDDDNPPLIRHYRGK